jgi:hypothetical protein
MWTTNTRHFLGLLFLKLAGGVTYPDRIGRNLGPFNPGIWSGNIMSGPTLRVSSVEDLNANGFSTLTTQAHQDVIGNGVWEPSGSVKGGGYTGQPGVWWWRTLETGDANVPIQGRNVCCPSRLRVGR